MQTERFSVLIHWPGNSDYNQYAPIEDDTLFSSPTLAGLVEKVRRFIFSIDAGGGNFKPEPVTRDGVPFCEMSYNGRCWRLGIGGAVHARATEMFPAEVDAQVERDVAHAKRPVKSYPENDTSNNTSSDFDE